MIPLLDNLAVLNSIQAIAFSETESLFRERATGEAADSRGEARPWNRRRRGSGAEARVKPKMGSPEYKEPSGGGCAAGAARWWRGDDERRPAVETKGGGGARVNEGEN